MTVTSVQPVPLRTDELYRKVRLTAGARFNAHRRLTWHERTAQWSVGLASVALIIVPLMQALGVTSGLTAQWLNVFQVVLALFVLVFSLLLSRDNYGVRADRIHRCGLELGQLLSELQSYRGKECDEDTYKRLCTTYYEILSRYENHATSDYERYLVYHRDEFYKDTRMAYIRHWAKAHIALAIGFLPYLLLVAMMVTAFWVMTRSH